MRMKRDVERLLDAMEQGSERGGYVNQVGDLLIKKGTSEV